MTLSALQQVGEGFHSLGDDVLRHMFDRMRPLVPAGRNSEGKPVAGAPDSFVGASARECTIAIEYTTFKAEKLGEKFARDYRNVREQCSRAREIVLCTNRSRSDEAVASVAALAQSEGITLTVVWGEQLAEILDDHRQDLRWTHLGIQPGTLTAFSIVPTLERRVRQSLDAYLGSSRIAELGQRISRRQLESAFHRLRHRTGATLVVGETGVGKTSWSAATAQQYSAHSPTAWLSARASAVDGLNDAVVMAGYGVVDPSKVHELAGILRSIKRVMLVFVDGIDEADDYASLALRVQEFLARSALAPFVHLVLTCRTEAVDAFEALMPAVVPKSTAVERSRRLFLDPLRRDESEALLRRVGVSGPESEALRKSLPEQFFGNPLYLRRALGLLRRGVLPSQSDRWASVFAEDYAAEIAARLQQRGSGPSQGAVRSALARLALGALVEPRGVDPSQVDSPLIGPGTAGYATFVGRAIQSGLLVRFGERVRFCHALYTEYFAAVCIAEDTTRSESAKVDAVSRLPGRSSIAAFVVQQSPTLLDAMVRDNPVLVPRFVGVDLPNQLREVLEVRAIDLLGSAFPSHRQAGIRLLASMKSQRTAAAAVDWFNGLPQAGKQERLLDAAELFLELEVAGAASVVAGHRRFRFPVDLAWYDPGFADVIDRLSSSLRGSLATHAVKGLASQVDSATEARLVMILTYLRDGRVVERLKEKVKNAPLAGFEHRALIYFNSDEAMDVYAASRRQSFGRLDAIEDKDAAGERRSEMWHDLIPLGMDILRFPHDALVRFVEKSLRSDDVRDRRFGMQFAEMVQDPALADAYAVAVTSERVAGLIPFHDQMIEKMGDWMTPGAMIDLYTGVITIEARRAVLHAAGKSPSERTEKLLLEALGSSELFGAASEGLARMRSFRAGPLIHARLAGLEGFERHRAIKCLGRIGYSPALLDLCKLLCATKAGGWEERELVRAIGCIGGDVAWGALEDHFDRGRDRDILSVLLDSPDDNARRALGRLVEKFPDAKAQLAAAIAHRKYLHDDVWYFDERAPRVEFCDEELLGWILREAKMSLAKAVDGARGDDLRYAYEAIALFSSSKATEFFVSLARISPERAPDDLFLAIWYARRLLVDRGDPKWMPVVVEDDLRSLEKQRWWSSSDVERLARWPREVVRVALLERAKTHPERWLRMFSEFADSRDREFIREHVKTVGPETADFIQQRVFLAAKREV